MILTLTNIRSWIVDAIPVSIKNAIGAGIGLFIALIGMQNSGIIVSNPSTLISLGDIHPNLLKTLARQTYRFTPFRVKRFSDKKRYALLAILVHQQKYWLTDMAVEMHDKILMMMESDARKSASAFLIETISQSFE